ncbi:MAG: SUMF1/EgtB/PvdO family nonheme iron enzyme [Pseudomonadota bacterium]
MCIAMHNGEVSAAEGASMSAAAGKGISRDRHDKPTAFPLLPGCPYGPAAPFPPAVKASPGAAPRPAPAQRRQPVQGADGFAGMILIPAGVFHMGSAPQEGRPDEHPRHEVRLKAFYIAKREVTVGEYCEFLAAEGVEPKGGPLRIDLDDRSSPIMVVGNKFLPREGMADHPVVLVSWQGACDYAKWAGGRLPNAAEWEKAALVTTVDLPGDYLTVLSRDGSVPVSLSLPGQGGIRGIIGNVWEWCADWYDRDYYSKSSDANPLGPQTGLEKEIRGGSWASPEASRRPANRHKAPPGGYFRTIGFRIVKDAGD